MKTSFLAILVAAAAIIEAAPQTSPSTSAAAASSSTAASGGNSTDPVVITEPIQGTTWTPGSSQNVTWQNVQQGVETLIINLMKGDATALQLVQALASGIDASKGSTLVDVPSNVTEGTYSVAVGSDSSHLAYMGGVIVSNSAGNSSTTASGASATASGTPSAVADAATLC
ncbi:hypothetical protein G6F26_012581 [Rhizopus arrhizus]|nr:hypothetical protein G6F26_012581 [Rhizopus arrhizus]KAG1324824.1 hypothetical protein G6F63_012424 [Rhizopus arrhizus]